MPTSSVPDPGPSRPRVAMTPTRWAAGGLHGLVWARGAALIERSVDPDVVDALWQAVRGVEDLGDFVNALSRATGQGLLGLPSFAVAVVGREDRVQVAARGHVVAYVLAENGDETVSGLGVNTWAERTVIEARAVVLQEPEANPGAVERSIESGVVPASSVAFAVTAAGAAAPVPVREEVRRVPVIETGPSQQRHTPGPTSGGWAVTGGQATLDPSSHTTGSALDPPATNGPDTLPPDTLPPGALAPVTRGPTPGPAPEPARPAAETVNAVLCVGGHANPPQRPTCRICGTALDGPTIRIARPSLGRLITPLGEVVHLDEPVIVGRAPRAARFRGTEVPRLLTLAHTHISANHLALRLDGWHVLVQDLGSTNGTFLRRTSEAPFRISEEPLVLVPGDVIDLGHGVHLRFEDLP